MGIKIQNETSHTTIAIVLSYLPAPTPSLFYRKVLVLPVGTRTDSPTWQCPGVIYAFEPPQGVPAEAVAQEIRVAMARFNVVRAGLTFGGGQIMDFLDLFGGLFDYVLEFIVELVLEELMEKLQDKVQARMDDALSDKAWDAKIAAAFSRTRRGSDDSRKSIEMARSMFLLGVGGMGLRRQHSIKRKSKNNYALTVQGGGIAWWS